jgi:type II secretory ATPase GspE/PulE/Tfp pilus assembly ATPase PilB-like protein
LRATDIHIDAVGSEYSVRFRIDGRLQRYCQLDGDVAAHLIQQFKTLARLDIADPFHPQEGRLRMPPELAHLEVRITMSPVAGGEAVALRIFDRESVFRPLDRLGLSKWSLAVIDGITQRGEGLVLVTGPTGSGKTTTVYSMLEALGNGERNIVSIEDPVEFPASFIRQMEVDERHGVTMTSGLRTLLRMDPDVMFLGEIRDTEAAEIAMRAASSGKYVFSTLHTRDVASTVTALRDMGIDARSLAENLTGIVSQRLVRRLCLECRQATSVNDEKRVLLEGYRIECPAQWFRAVGCSACRGTGYRGRIGIFEVVLVDEELLREIARGAAEHELREYIRRLGTRDLQSDALTKVCDGITSFDEAIKMCWV